jgi:restriction system protein
MARGFFAELQRQAKQAARERERAQKESHRAYAAALREAEAAKKQDERARVQSQKASAAEQKRLEKEAKESHEAAMATEVECLNLKLAEIDEELTGILAATLGVDDFVDLETLRAKADHPEFDRPDLLADSRPPLPIIDPPAPALVEPQPLRGVMAILGKKGLEKKKLAAQARHEAEMIEWQMVVEQNQILRKNEATAYQQKENERLIALESEQARYAAECAKREEAAALQNQEVDDLIANLGYGTKEAIEEYIGIVLSNAVYPEHFPIGYGFTFEPSVAELRLRVAVLAPNEVSTVKNYKYTKATDEITAVDLSAKACKDRYTNAINQVALRVPHEIFEADRRGLIGTISLEVGTQANDPATGLANFIPFVALAVGRDEFMKLDLANVVPAATLAHLGASISKNPYELVPANTSGVRRT